MSALWEAAGKALLHFLWQGALLGLAAAAVLRAWRERSPESRYGAACVFYLAMALSPFATLAALLAEPSTAAPRFPAAPEAALRWLPAIWAFGVTGFALRAGGGWVHVRLRVFRGRRPPPGDLARRCSRLASALGIERTVRLFVTSGGAGPSVFGWLRPAILVPAGALAGLPTDQLEAVLAHELAHIARRDFLVNCLQTAVEVLLFYHPAVWWLSKRIRRERELCCDAAAVALCGNRLTYSRALLALEEWRAAFALAASGGGLKERIVRILNPHQDHTTGWPVTPVTLALIVLVGGCWAAAQAPSPPASPQAPVAAIPPGPPPTPPAQAALPAPPAPPAAAAIPAPPAPPAPRHRLAEPAIAPPPPPALGTAVAPPPPRPASPPVSAPPAGPPPSAPAQPAIPAPPPPPPVSAPPAGPPPSAPAQPTIPAPPPPPPDNDGA